MTAVIICNGLPPTEKNFQEVVYSADKIIAADGGAYSCLRYNVIPDVVIGDLDSFNSSQYPDINVIKNLDQETNDLEKALKYALDQGIRLVVILGASGYRLDHTLKNLSVLKQFSKMFDDIYFRENEGTIRILPKKFKASATPGQLISLFPISGIVEGIKTSGLKYPLNNETLENGVRDGTSNEATDYEFSIEYKTGYLLLFLYDFNT